MNSEHVHSYLVHGDNAAEASERITQLLLEVYAEKANGVTVTTQQGEPPVSKPVV